MSSPICLSPRPFFAILEVTSRCNSRCVYCQCWRVGRMDEISSADYHEVLSQLYTLGVRRLILTGGEPLLRKDLEVIVRTGYDRRLHTSVVTNGIALTPQRLEALIQSGLLGLTLSLDTLNPVLYRCLRGVEISPAIQAVSLLEQAARQGLSVSINVVLTALNYTDLPKLVRYTDQRGIPLMIQPCNIDSRPELDYLIPTQAEIPKVQAVIDELIVMKAAGARILSSESFLHNIPTYWKLKGVPPVKNCYYGHVTVTIKSTGEVCSCWRMPIVGRIPDQSIFSIWNGEAFAFQREKMAEGRCPGCWLACSFDWETLWCTEETAMMFWEARLTEIGTFQARGKNVE